MSSSAGITLLRAVEHTRTEHQLRPGEGFAPDFTPVADRVTSMDAGRTLLLAKPPAWTAAAKPCDGKFDQYDDHRSRNPKVSAATRARLLCQGCPVKDECLEDALQVEGAVGLHRADTRHGIRGGLTPSGRVALARKLQEEETGVVA